MESNYAFTVTSEMTPSVQIVASYIGENDEVIADVITINTAVAFENQVSVTPQKIFVKVGSEFNTSKLKNILFHYTTFTSSLFVQVNITSPVTSVDAGTDVMIRVDTSASGSYVGIRAVDQSVLLLRSGTDITKEKVGRPRNVYSISSTN